MTEKIEEKETFNCSRRQLLGGAGKLAMGAVVFSAAGIPALGGGRASAEEGGECLENPVTTPSGAQYPWPYTRLDPEITAARAYDSWYKGFCAYAVTNAILGQLQEKLGEPYASLPIEAFSFGHGGTVGWGTLCGTLFGAGISASFTAGHGGEKVINDVMAWYSDSELPVFTPENPRAEIRNTSSSGSPLCHVSVGKWMDREEVKFFSPERKDRCARLAADVARKTVTILNAKAEGIYTPVHGSQAKMHQMTAQNNCTDCHGAGIPDMPGKK